MDNTLQPSFGRNYIIQRIKDNFVADFPVVETMPVVSNKKITDKGKAVHIQGHSDLAVKFAKCCMPVPGDTIIGYITRGRGISVHRADCINIKHTDETDRLIDVNWLNDIVPNEKFSAELMIKAFDRKGLISDISTIISNEGISIAGFTSKTYKDGTVNMNMNIIIQNTKQVDKLIGKISVIPGVISIYRT
jgi:GTP pyrophosphokinase